VAAGVTAGAPPRAPGAPRSALRTDVWLEIFENLSRNRLRTGLTSLSVAWGIFMLVVLLGFGKGLENQVTYQFRDDAINSIWIYSGETSMPWAGLPVGRGIRFQNADYDRLRELPGVEYITSRFYLQGEFTISYKDQAGAYQVRSCHPDHRYLENTIITQGRFLNALDIARKRKVTVIGDLVADFLFQGEPPLGKEIIINGIPYQVVGVFEDTGGEGERRKVYIPISTAQVAYGGGERVHQIMFTVGDATVEETQALTEDVRALLAERHRFDPADPRAVRVRNNIESYQEVQQIFFFISTFIWIVGVGTVTAGIVGVSNIMLISVRERTREFGLRKALGATPASIVGLVLREAVMLTAVSGYIGLVAGVGLLAVVSAFSPENDYIRDPQVDLGVAFGATALLVLTGVVAGFFPARRAAAVNPIEALRAD
jgi:putative ABC transport system permease protein